MEPASDPWTCLKAALYWTSNLEQAPVYLQKQSKNYVYMLMQDVNKDVVTLATFYGEKNVHRLLL